MTSLNKLIDINLLSRFKSKCDSLYAKRSDVEKINSLSVVDITLAEYKALSTEQKNDRTKLYAITDISEELGV